VDHHLHTPRSTYYYHVACGKPRKAPWFIIATLRVLHARGRLSMDSPWLGLLQNPNHVLHPDSD
jgi:hypothetical protein